VEHAWKQLRGQYIAYLRKLKKPTGSGAGRKPTFRHSEFMEFYRDLYRPYSRYTTNLNHNETKTLLSSHLCCLKQKREHGRRERIPKFTRWHWWMEPHWRRWQCWRQRGLTATIYRRRANWQRDSLAVCVWISRRSINRRNFHSQHK
jgi:hypothetical protein